jgi:hypothetical protein
LTMQMLVPGRAKPMQEAKDRRDRPAVLRQDVP